MKGLLTPRRIVLFVLFAGVLTLYVCVQKLGGKIDFLCLPEDSSCRSFWVQGVMKPFRGGYLLPALALAPLLFLFNTRKAFWIWFAMTLVAIPLMVNDLIYHVPIYADYFDKLSVNKLYGILYFGLSVVIAVAIPLGEWGWRKFKKQA